MQAKRVFYRFLLFALLGLVMELFFTGLGRLQHGDINMQGHSSPWMMLDYGLLGIVTMYLATPMINCRIPLVFRAIVYMLGIFFIEYTSGMFFTHVLHLDIWNYHNKPYNLHGQIALSFVVPWYLLGLFVEFLYRRVDVCATALARGLTADQLLALCGGSEQTS